MRYLTRMFVTIVLLAGPLAGRAQAETIRFGVSVEPYPPFAATNAAGKPEGFEIDLIGELCKRLKPSRCEVRQTPWDGIIAALLARRIDVIFASMSITDERRKTIDFSIPYYSTPGAIAARKDSRIDTTAESVAGKIIGVERATIAETFVDKYFAAIATVKVYNTQDEADADLAAGRIDATVADSATLEPFIGGHKELALKGFYPKDDPIWGDGVGAGLRKTDIKLRARLNEAIRAVYKDGTFATLERKFFNYDIGTPPRP
jgi:polar amino acid transport system substrate-binding protein